MQLIISNKRIFEIYLSRFYIGAEMHNMLCISDRSHKRDQIITFIKDSKSHANCECFTLILHILCPHLATPCTAGKQ